MLNIALERKMIVVYLVMIPLISVNADSTLKLVNLLYRHGDRSPITIYDTNPNGWEKWPGGEGWLQTIGMQQHYTLGGWLRRRYIDSGFLSTDYDNTEIKIYSSDIERCLMSAYCNLAGMFPPGPDHMFNDTLNWQPIPVHTRPTYEDNTLSLRETCPRYQQLYADAYYRPDILRLEQQNQDFYAWLSQKTGVVESLGNLWEISDTLVCEASHNFTLPTWLNATVREKLSTLTNHQVSLRFSSTEMRRLKGGPLLKELVSNMQKKIKQSTTFKMFMYSAHDTTVASLLSVLDIYNHITPPYAAMVIMELHQNSTGDYSVKLFYKNSTVNSDDILEMAIPNCEHDCPLTEFLNLTKPVIPTDWLKECGLSQHPMSSPNPSIAGPTSPAIAQNTSGPMCFSCNDVTHLKYCDFTKRCQENEVCFVSQTKSVDGRLRFQSGCIPQQQCSSANPNTAGVTSSPGMQCLHCCSGDYCNKEGCGDLGFQDSNGRGPLCLDCAHVGKVEECDTIKLCSPNQVCKIEEYTWGENDRLFKLGCEDQLICILEGRDHLKRSSPVCSSCCLSDFCNRNCTSGAQPALVG